MLRDMNKGFMILCKTITANLLEILGLLVEPSTSISKPKGCLEAFLPIGKPLWTLTYKYPMIYSSLSSFFSFSSMLISNSISHPSIGCWWSTVESYVRNSAGRCGSRNRTRKMKCTESRNCLSIIHLINGRYVIFWGPYINRK